MNKSASLQILKKEISKLKGNKFVFYLIVIFFSFVSFGYSFKAISIQSTESNSMDTSFESRFLHLVDSCEKSISDYHNSVYEKTILLQEKDSVTKGLKYNDSLLIEFKKSYEENLLDFINKDSQYVVKHLDSLYKSQIFFFDELRDTKNKISELKNKKPEIENKVKEIENKIKKYDTNYNKILELFDLMINSDSTPISLTIPYNKVKYRVVIASTKEDEIKIYANETRRARDLNFVYKKMKSEGREVLALMNGGMFDSIYSSVGLLIQDFKMIKPINKNKEDGNFYLLPNGIFYLDSANRAYVRETIEFDKQFDINKYRKIKYATQSGPMLLIDGIVHKSFAYGGHNLNIRNGVGIIRKSKNSKVAFVISEQPVSFYDFALFFKDILRCDNALYLDGAISKMYINDNNKISGKLEGGSFGPIISVLKKSKK
jgi:uncharacterized protein YigE (DUF2233 family)